MGCARAPKANHVCRLLIWSICIDGDVFLQAIVEFYRTADGRQKTHTWLSAIQCSPEAWQFSWTLISENKVNKSPSAVQYLISMKSKQTIDHKVFSSCLFLPRPTRSPDVPYCCQLRSFQQPGGGHNCCVPGSQFELRAYEYNEQNCFKSKTQIQAFRYNLANFTG